MTPPRIAVATQAASPDLALDASLMAALREAGVDAVIRTWNDEAVDWSRFDGVVIRSTWDYINHLDAFLSWADQVEAVTALANPAGVIRWNSDKRYLADLRQSGIPIVPTRFVTDPAELDGQWPDAVVKPVIGAGAIGAARFTGDREEARRHAGRLIGMYGVAMAQPYIPSVDDAWEIGIYFAGEDPTHAVRKQGVLRPGRPPATDHSLAIAQRVEALSPPPDLVDFAREVRAAVPGREVLYARVDIVGIAGEPHLMELELIEPCLFLDRNPQVAGAYATAIAKWAST